MRYSILGFNQEKIMTDTNLDLTDLLLLDYIIKANSLSNMRYILEDNDVYVWIYHKKIQEDLPILNISDGTLKNRLSTLKKEGIIKSKQVANEKSKGTKTYYAITDFTKSLLNSDTTSLKNDVEDLPRHSKMTSDNINISNISKDILEDKEKPKKKKKSLYEQCYDEIVDHFGEDTELVSKIDEFLRLCLKEKWVQYKPQWVYKLKDLENVEGDKLKSVEQTLKCGWKSFYEPKENNYQKPKFTDVQQHSEKAREEDIIDVKF